MKVFIIEAFTGYPNGTDASQTTYTAGQEADVPDEFGRLIVEKGHARIEEDQGEVRSVVQAAGGEVS